MNLYWFNQTVAYWSIMLLVVPLKYIKKLFIYGLLGGFLYTWIVQFFAVIVLKRWDFAQDIFTIYGIPFFFAMSWFGVTILYGYLLMNYSRYQFYILTFFVLLATFMDYAAIYSNKVSMTNWTIVDTLMFAVFSHVVLLYLLKYMYGIDSLGAHEDVLMLKIRKRK